MFIAVGAFSFMDALLMALGRHYGAFQVSTLRAAASLPIVLLPLLLQGRLRELLPTRPLLHLLRGVLGVLMLTTFIVSLSGGSLANVYAIYMIAPVLIVALAGLLLGERVPVATWAAVLIGLCGVLVIVQPTSGGLTPWAAAAAGASALGYAVAAVLARLLARTDSAASMVVSFLLFLLVACALLGVRDWQPVQHGHWPLVAGIGLTGAIGQQAITQAFKLAPASVVAPIEYTALLWGMAIDFATASRLPSATMLAGAALIVIAGVSVVARRP
jgi:drug/metabolite transporter (DMT)-like permease